MNIFLIFFYTLIESSISCIFVKLSDGIIKGRIARIPDSKSIFYAFQEIPYAAPPIGELRFQPPQPVSPWKGIRDTTKNTKICYQVGINSDQETEDCLYLNVYTPKLPSKQQSNLPVMVYIHGGGFIIGDSTHKSYGPEFFINRGVVIVTLNYRLGVFGFLSTQDATIPGNYGLKDQLLALQWVNKNIHLFGGDASKVTIFGQSAGAASVGYHLISKKAKGLYRAAIMESGSPLCPWSYQRNARYYAFKTASLIYPNINSANTSSQELLEAMLQAPALELDKATENVAGEESINNAQLFQGYFYAPVIELESEKSFLTKKMFETISNGGADQVPIIMGINSEESLSQTTDLAFLKTIMGGYDKNLRFLVPNDMNINSDNLNKTTIGEEIRQEYSGNELLQNVPAAGVRYMSDMAFTRAVIKHASLQSQFSEVYFYQFSYDGKMGNVSITVEGAERVGHNEENAYFWRIDNAMFHNYDLTIYPTTDVVTQNRLLTLWTNFAKYLTPTPLLEEILQNIYWKKVSSSFAYLNIDQDLKIKYQPKEEISRFWNALYEEHGNPPYDTY